MKHAPERTERCLEPVSRAWIRHLIVPHIYFEAVIGDFYLDLLAVDRAGTGQSHGVRIYTDLESALTKGVADMLQAPTHYRWLAYQGDGILPRNEVQEAQLKTQKLLFPAAGMGRLGVIEIVGMANQDLGANVRVKAERFKVQTQHLDLLTQFVKAHRPDIDFDD